MNESNLPPGVSESDIPGNRPIDILWDKAQEAVSPFGMDVVAQALGIHDDLWEILFDKAAEKFDDPQAFVQKVREANFDRIQKRLIR